MLYLLKLYQKLFFLLNLQTLHMSCHVENKLYQVKEEVHTQVATTNVKLTLVSKPNHPPNVTSSVKNIDTTKIECHKIPFTPYRGYQNVR